MKREPKHRFPLDPVYQMWRLERLPRADDLYRQRLSSLALRYQPTVSILTPVFNTEPHALSRMLLSVRKQTYPHWQHCLVDDGSTAEWLTPYLAGLAAGEPRIRLVRRQSNGGIVAATNDALALATGEFIGLLDHDDELDPQALYAVVSRLNDEPDLDMLYTDLDVLDPAGRHVHPVFKPGWSPELLLRVNYLAHLNVYRRSLLQRLGGWRSGLDGSQDYDMALRASSVTQRVAHIPRVLYHWRQSPRSAAEDPDAKPYAFAAAKEALIDHLRRNGVDARRDDGPIVGYHSVRFGIRGEPFVAVIVLVPRGLSLFRVRAFVDSVQTLMAGAGYERCETVIVTPARLERRLETACQSLKNPPRIVRCAESHDVGLMANAGAAAARGDQLVFVSWPVVPRRPAWLSAMIEYAQQAPIGAVGAKIYSAEGQLWHSGVLLPRAVPLLMSSENQWLILNYSAVSRACLMTRRSTFDEAGGFRPASVVGHPDFDYCLRLRDRGYRHVVAEHAELSFTGSIPRDASPVRSPRFEALWRDKLAIDPYYNPNFSQDDAAFRLPLAATQSRSRR